MSTVTAFRPPPSPEELSEKEVRVQLAACYRLVAHFGMDDLVFTHISARVPGLVNLYGIESRGLTASLALAEHVLTLMADPAPAPVAAAAAAG